MTASIPSFEALELISKRFVENKIIHALGGSGLLFALGVIEKVKDWDIATEAPLENVIEALKGLESKIIPNNELFKSQYLIKVAIGNTEIDNIGYFSIKKSNGASHIVPVKNFKDWNGIPLADPYEWLLAYKLMGREDMTIKLETYLKAGLKIVN